MTDHYFKFSPSVILLPFLSVLFLWIVFWAGLNFHLNLETYGIYPRTFEGCGDLFSPFIHGKYRTFVQQLDSAVDSDCGCASLS
jgi:hypothetical protein